MEKVKFTLNEIITIVMAMIEQLRCMRSQE